jgi:hypothetical protein
MHLECLVIDLNIPPTHQFYVRNKGVFFTIKQRIDFLDRFTLCLNPVVPLLTSAMRRMFWKETTHDETKDCNVP